jgi:hypothetical protein
LLYAIVGIIALTGMTQLSWWAAAVGCCLLSLKLIAEDRPMLGGNTAAWEITLVGSNLLIGIVASILAFGGGRLTAVLWGL